MTVLTRQTPSPAPARQAPPDASRILELLASRRSCRDFDGSPIAASELEAIVRDGTQAPSSCNQQQWHFIIVAEPELKRRARDIAGGNPHFAQCSALIYLAFQKGWTHDNFSVVQSVAGACYHMMLSAHLRGFDCNWNAGIGDKQQLGALLGLPPTFELQGALALGRAVASAPPMKAPRRDFGEVHSWNRFERPATTLYPVKPAEAYPYAQIRNNDNPFAQWDPQAWSWDQVADFRGYSVWAKSPLSGVYVSRRQGAATEAELALLPTLADTQRVLEIMPWGGTYSVELRRRLAPQAQLHLAELSAHNLGFIRERFRQESLDNGNTHFDLIENVRLPYADASMDAIVAPQVLEHMPNPCALLDEMRRVLRPGGSLLVSVRILHSAYGALWLREESRGQVPLEGPFQPLPATTVREWLAARFTLEAEAGIGTGAAGDAEQASVPNHLGSRLYAARCRRMAS